ncbi:MAG: hypothetical protein ABI627_19660 [Polyangiaceae bacterium]
MGREQQGAAVYYRFQDSNGRLHIVDSLESVPQALRPQALRVAYSEQPTTTTSLLQHRLSGLETFGLGFGAAMLVVFVFKRLPGTMAIALRIAIVAVIACLLGGGYMGWVRRATGQSGATFASPTQIIDDAKDAVAKMNARQQADQTQLKEIEQAK